MIFSTQNQLNCAIIFLFFALIAGLVFNFIQTILLIKYKKIFIKNIFYCVFYAFFCIFFIFLLNFFNFGKFSLLLLLVFLMGFNWALKLVKKTFVIFENMWYNTIKKIKQKHKTKEKFNTDEISSKS